MGLYTQSKTILLVDDEKMILEFVSAILKQHDHNLLIADSGESALRQSREHKGTIHLLLSNIQMPGLTGMELGTKIVQERPEIRVLLMSGFASGMLVLNKGWHFLHKPFVPSQLLALISDILSAPYPAEIPDLDEHKDGSGIE